MIMALTLEEKDYDQRIKGQSLDIRFDEQLETMRDSHAVKLPHVAEDLDKITRYPDAVRYELEQQFKEDFKGRKLVDAIEEELLSQRDYYLWKTAKLNEVVELIDKEVEFRKDGLVNRIPVE